MMDETKSEMKTLVDLFASLTLGRVKLSQTMKTGAIQKAVKWCDDHTTGGDGAKRVKTGIRMIETDAVTGEERCVDLTIASMQALWGNAAYSLPREWATPKAFLVVASLAAERYAVAVEAKRARQAAVTDAATERLYDDGQGVERKVEWITLGESLLPPGVSEPDREFLYDHLRSNSGAFYWISAACVPVLIPRKEQTGYISQDPEFWGQWQCEAYQQISEYADAVKANAELTLQEQPEEGGLPTESLDQRLLRFIPRVVLENLRLGIRRKKEQNGPWGFDGFSVSLNAKGGGSGMSMSAWQARMAEKLLASVSMRDVGRIKQFSNTTGDALTHFSLDGIDLSGAEGRRRAANGEGDAPNLPPHWMRFIWGKDGNTAIFEGDPEMSALRLAYFVTQLVQETGYTRQILFIAGSGNDGKSVLMETLRDLLGGQCSCTLNGGKIAEDSTQWSILNKSLICVPEVKDPRGFLQDEFVKKITGKDTLTLRRLYTMPIEYHPEHAFLMATTNTTVYANGRAAYSRLLPLTFRINYGVADQLSPDDLKKSLLSERDRFLQWCFDTLAYYQTRNNTRGESLQFVMANALRLISDDRYHSWLEGEPLIAEDASFEDQQKAVLALQKEAINSCGAGRFLALDNEDSEEDDSLIFGRLFERFFEVDPDVKTPKADIMQVLVENATSTEVRLAGIKPEKIQYCGRYRAFLAYLKSLQGVQEITYKDHGCTVKGFWGLKVKQSPILCQFSNPL